MSFDVNHREENQISLFQEIWIFLAVCLPIISIVFCFWHFAGDYRYPVYSWQLLLAIGCLLPSILLLFGMGSRFCKRKFVKRLLIVLCLLACPVGSISTVFSVSRSETTGIYDYHHFESRCSANWDLMFQELFPSPDNIWPDRYYYYFEDIWDEYYLIYAEDQKTEAEFSKEVARVTEFFETHKPTEERIQNGAIYSCQQKGSFQLMVIYLPGRVLGQDTDGRYYAFAYCPEKKIVRYFHINNLWEGQAYSLNLEW